MLTKTHTFLRLLFDLTFMFKTDTCLNVVRWVAAMILRGILFYLFAFYENKILSYNSILVFPICLFFLYWAFTSLLMFLGMLYVGRLSSDNSMQTDLTEISRFLNWRDNKMQFLSYTDAQKLMKDTAILNNLDSSNPEARRQLDYINNKLRFLSYTEGCDFLRGKL